MAEDEPRARSLPNDRIDPPMLDATRSAENGDVGSEVRMHRPTWSVTEHRVAQPPAQCAMAADTVVHSSQIGCVSGDFRGRVGSRMTVPGRDVFEVAARAPVVGMIESLGDHGPRPLAEIARYRRRGDQPAGRCVREDQIGWRSGLSRRTSSGAVAGEAGVVSNRRERLAVTGPTIVLQKGVSFRQWTARPLLVDLDHAVAAVGEEQGDRQHQAADQNREPERPGQTSPAEKARLGREDRALVTARQRIPDFNGAGQCDDRLVSHARAEGQAIMADHHLRRRANVQFNVAPEVARDFEAVLAQRFDPHPTRRCLGKPRVTQLGRQVSQVNVAVGPPTYQRRLGGKWPRPVDLASAKPSRNLMKGEAHRVFTSRRRR